MAVATTDTPLAIKTSYIYIYIYTIVLKPKSSCNCCNNEQLPKGDKTVCGCHRTGEPPAFSIFIFPFDAAWFAIWKPANQLAKNEQWTTANLAGPACDCQNIALCAHDFVMHFKCKLVLKGNWSPSSLRRSMTELFSDCDFQMQRRKYKTQETEIKKKNKKKTKKVPTKDLWTDFVCCQQTQRNHGN